MAIDYEVVSSGPIAPGTFRLRPRRKNSIGYDAMIEATALRVNQTPQVVRGVIDGFLDEAYAQILLGNAVQFRDIGSLFVSMRQTLATQGGGFDPALGEASLDFIVSTGWQAKLEAEASFNKVDADLVEPQIQNLFNVANSQNDQATRGNIVRITGARLAFDSSDATQGVFFVSAGGAETHVTVYENIGDNKIVCLVPAALAVGTYTLKVKAKYTTAGATRVGTYLNSVAVI